MSISQLRHLLKTLPCWANLLSDNYEKSNECESLLQVPAVQRDKMESFWLAETLK